MTARELRSHLARVHDVDAAVEHGGQQVVRADVFFHAPHLLVQLLDLLLPINAQRKDDTTDREIKRAVSGKIRRNGLSHAATHLDVVALLLEGVLVGLQAGDVPFQPAHNAMQHGHRAVRTTEKESDT